MYVEANFKETDLEWVRPGQSATVEIDTYRPFFVLGEVTFTHVVRDQRADLMTRIQQLVAQRRIGSRTVQKLHHNLDEVLSAVQFGITLASLGIGFLGEPAIASLFVFLRGIVPLYIENTAQIKEWSQPDLQYLQQAAAMVSLAMKKLGVGSVAELARLAIRHGIVKV